MRVNGSKYCPSCGQDVALDANLEGAYLMMSCANCGLGLGLKVANSEEIHLFQSATPPVPALGSAPAGLARVGLAKRPVPLTGAVERPSPPDPRSATPAPRPQALSPEASGEMFGSGESILSTQGMQAIQVMAPPASSVPAGGEPSLGGPVRQMRSVFLVEDSAFLRQVAKDLLVTRNLAKEVIESPDGPSFLEEFTRAAVAGRKPELVILDVRMPDVDGRDVAFALRAIEAGLGVKRTPLLFFSAVLCDEPFKQVLADLGNAKYIRKADGGDVQQLGERIVAVLERLVGTRK
jgi:CheY-like chemotaxis protein